MLLFLIFLFDENRVKNKSFHLKSCFFPMSKPCKLWILAKKKIKKKRIFLNYITRKDKNDWFWMKWLSFSKILWVALLSFLVELLHTFKSLRFAPLLVFFEFELIRNANQWGISWSAYLCKIGFFMQDWFLELHNSSILSSFYRCESLYNWFSSFSE